MTGTQELKIGQRVRVIKLEEQAPEGFQPSVISARGLGKTGKLTRRIPEKGQCYVRQGEESGEVAVYFDTELGPE